MFTKTCFRKLSFLESQAKRLTVETNGSFLWHLASGAQGISLFARNYSSNLVQCCFRCNVSPICNVKELESVNSSVFGLFTICQVVRILKYRHILSLCVYSLITRLPMDQDNAGAVPLSIAQISTC